MRKGAGRRPATSWRPPADFRLSTGLATPVLHRAVEFRAASTPAYLIQNRPLADPTKRPHSKKSPYTVDRGMPGAFEGETVTRRGLMTGGALAAGGIASAAFGLPALGFALGPNFSRTEPHRWQDVGPEADFNKASYVQKI